MRIIFSILLLCVSTFGQVRIKDLPRATSAQATDILVLDRGTNGVFGIPYANLFPSIGQGDLVSLHNLKDVADTNAARLNLNAASQTDFSGLSNFTHTVTIYATDFGAVGDYTGAATRTGTGTDNRTNIQAALDSAYTAGTLGRNDPFGATYHRVKVPKGKYYISAPTNGMPSLVVPLGVEFDFSEAELHFDIPPANFSGHSIVEPNPAWCGILVGPEAGLRIGHAQIAAGKDQTYGGAWFGFTLDCIRVQESDYGWIKGDGLDHYIFGFFRGAGIRYLGCYDQHVTDVNFGSCAFGVVMGYMGNAFSAYTLYRGGSDAERVSTSLWLDNCVFRNMYRTPIYVGAGGDWYDPHSPGVVAGGLETIVQDGRSQNGGPISVSHCSIENAAWGAISAFCPNGSVLINDLRLEECDDATVSIGVIYANSTTFKINGLEFGSTGTRGITLASYTGTNSVVTCVPNLLVRCDGINVSPLLQNAFVNNAAINSAILCSLSSNSRLPTIINYRTSAASQMQGVGSNMHGLIPDNDGGRVWSVSTVGLLPAESVGGGRTTFTFANGFTPQKPTRILVDGQFLEATDAAGTNWSWNSTTGVVTLTVAPTKIVRAFF